MPKAKLLANVFTKMDIGTTIALNDSILNYDAILIQFWATLPDTQDASRKFSSIDTQLINDVGNSSRYIEGSIFYSNDYYATAGICYQNNTTLLVKEMSYKGYSGVYTGNVYGLHLK